MNRFFISLLLVLHLCVSTTAQEYDKYMSVLHPKPYDTDFPDVMHGLQISRNDSLVRRTNPIFWRARCNNYSACSILLNVKGYDRDLFYSDEVWVALDENFRLMFVFPIGTQEAYYNEEYKMFKYTTHCTSTHDFWYNSGIIDMNGSVVSPAVNRSFCFISNGKAVSIFKDVEENGETMKFVVQYMSLDDHADKLSVDIKIPNELGKMLNSAEDFNSPLFKEDPFNSAVSAFYDAEDMRIIAARFKEAAKSSDKLLSDCARYNEKAIKSAIKSARKAHNNAH